MTVYLITIATSLLALFAAEQLGVPANGFAGASARFAPKYRRWRPLLYAAAFFILFVPAALRYAVGNDYFSYTAIFESIHSGNYDRLEPGYRLLNQLVARFTSNAQWVLALCSLLTLLLFFICIRRYSVAPVLSLYLFFTMLQYAYSFSAVRQYLALALVLYGYKYIRSGNFPAFLLLTLLAATFHKSALIMLPLYLLLRLRFKMSHYLVLFAAGLLLTLFREQVMDVIFRFVYSSYEDSPYLNFHISYLNIFQSGLVAAGCLAYYRPLMEKKENIILINAAMLSLILYLSIPGWLGNALSRVALYLNIYHIFTIPAVLRCEPNKALRRFYTAAIVVGYFALFLVLMRSNRDGGGMGVFPYQSIFSKGGTA